MMNAVTLQYESCAVMSTIPVEERLYGDLRGYPLRCMKNSMPEVIVKAL